MKVQKVAFSLMLLLLNGPWMVVSKRELNLKKTLSACLYELHVVTVRMTPIQVPDSDSQKVGQHTLEELKQ